MSGFAMAAATLSAVVQTGAVVPHEQSGLGFWKLTGNESEMSTFASLPTADFPSAIAAAGITVASRRVAYLPVGTSSS